jgi:hypothetical protein
MDIKVKMVFEGNKVENTKVDKHTENISHLHIENMKKCHDC